jgi:7-cyano-7-deazaguanine reductase
LIKTDRLPDLADAPLGKKSAYVNIYTADLLFPISRKPKREEIGIIGEKLPFQGYDLWTAYEVSWLNPNGKPLVALAELRVPCESPFLIESKSLKLYFNSFNNSRFESLDQVQSCVQKDLSNATGADVQVKLIRLNDVMLEMGFLEGQCLDDLDVKCTEYLPQKGLLVVTNEVVEETFHTNLLKSNCLVTGQPDWGSVQVTYRGKKILKEGFLKYIVSLRDHNEFHEQCVERIFCDIQSQCAPEKLTVFARYTRRGGLDINPLRTNAPDSVKVNQFRLVRQ